MSVLALLIAVTSAWAQPRLATESLDSSLNLHNHTYCSDGSDTPEGFIEVVKKAGVKVVAVTDHDTVACVERAAAAGKKAGVRVIPGIEISADDDSMHILGLNVDVASPRISALVDKNRAARLERARETIAKLNALRTKDGKPIHLELREILLQKVDAVRRADGKDPADPKSSEEQLLAEAGPVTRPDVALAMVAKGYVPDTRAAFDQFLGDEGAANAGLDGPAFADAIALIHSAGGLAVLAHPHTIYKFKQPPYSYSGKSYRDFDALLEDMLAAGLDGVEQYKAGHGPDERLVAQTDAFGASHHKRILLTPGSDYHGSSGVGQPHFDAIGIPPAMAKSILEAFTGKVGGATERPPVLTGVIRGQLENVRFDTP